jgi:hypothetical protein
MSYLVTDADIDAISEAVGVGPAGWDTIDPRELIKAAWEYRSAPSAIRTKVCRTDGRCQYAIDHGAEGMGHCPVGKCAMPAEAAPSPLYAGNVFMIDGRLHRTCDCSPSINKCARGLPRTLLTTEFGRCMVPV